MKQNKKKAQQSSRNYKSHQQEKAADRGQKTRRGCIFVSETVHNWADFEKRRELDKPSGAS